MSHEILSIKLRQLDDRVSRLHSRIHLSETASHIQLQQEIDAMKRECAESETVLLENLRHSRSRLVAILSQGYSQMEQIVQEMKEQLHLVAEDSWDAETVAEEKLLLAEYALDFAHQAADRALLLSMDAIDTQLLQKERRPQ